MKRLFYIANQTNKFKAFQSAVNKQIHITLSRCHPFTIRSKKDGSFYTISLKNRN